MSEIAIAFNRFGLGTRAGDSAPANARAWLANQLDRYEPNPAAIAAAPSRSAVAGQLADYIREQRAEAQQGRRARRGSAMQDEDDGEAMAMRPAGQRPGMGMDDNLAGLPDSARRFVRRAGRDHYLAMVAARTNAALTAEAPFVERMVHFWANHFAVSADKLTVIGLAGLLEFEAIRPHVLGRFRDMLSAVERHPAMLLYLDQAQSIGPGSQAAAVAARFARGRQRRGLNENLAREILELHTLGVDGGYAQADVTEFARAMTGWTVNGLTRGPAARFLGATGSARPVPVRRADPRAGRAHDPRPRLPPAGRGAGVGGARRPRRSPATARHLAAKLARHFAGDEPPPAMVERLTQAWLRSGGDLPTVYRAIIDSPEAWASAAGQVQDALGMVARGAARGRRPHMSSRRPRAG